MECGGRASDDAALGPDGQIFAMLPTLPSQSAVAARLPTDFAGALHTAPIRVVCAPHSGALALR